MLRLIRLHKVKDEVISEYLRDACLVLWEYLTLLSALYHIIPEKDKGERGNSPGESLPLLFP